MYLWPIVVNRRRMLRFLKSTCINRMHATWKKKIQAIESRASIVTSNRRSEFPFRLHFLNYLRTNTNLHKYLQCNYKRPKFV